MRKILEEYLCAPALVRVHSLVLPFLDVMLQTYMNMLWHEDEERLLDEQLEDMRLGQHSRQPYHQA